MKYYKRIDYAKVFVIISADQELKTTILVFVGREVEFKVEYEWFPTVCNKCKIFWHNIEACPKSTTEAWRPFNQKATSKNQSSKGEGNIGSSITPTLKENQLVEQANSSQDKDMGGR